jgi:Rhodopirellula transposase DDE domain
VEITEEALGAMFAVLSPHLDERQRRLLAGAQARALGRGGIAAVARPSGMARSTVQSGTREVEGGPAVSGRVRQPGAGRPKVTERDPGLLAALDALVEPDTRGDRMSPLRWTATSTRTLAEELTAQGHPVSNHTVGALLAGMGYSLQATSKQVEGAQHPDRDAQFRYLNEQASAQLHDGQPVISVDTKKQEVVGDLATKGREWQPKGSPVRVDVHDFPDPTVGKAIPFGVDDLGADAGWVTVGDDHDTAAFAVATIRRWWEQVARPPTRTPSGC